MAGCLDVRYCITEMAEKLNVQAKADSVQGHTGRNASLKGILVTFTQVPTTQRLQSLKKDTDGILQPFKDGI